MKVTKEKFFEDMNKHPSTAYRRRGENIIEVELFQPRRDSSDRVHIRVWRPEKNDDGSFKVADENHYEWHRRASAFHSIDKYISEDANPHDHAESVAEIMADSDYHFNHFVTNNEGRLVGGNTA